MAGATVGLVGNGLEATAAAGMAVAPEGVLTKVGAVGLGLLAVDGAQANIRTIVSGGEPTPTFLAQGVAGAASYVTDESTAQVVGSVVDAGAHMGATAYSAYKIPTYTWGTRAAETVPAAPIAAADAGAGLTAGDAVAATTQVARPVITRPPNLTPGQALADDEIITMIGGNSPAKFKLNPQDLKPLEGVTAPGKSASIAVDLSPEFEVLQAFGRPAAKQDIVLAAQVKDIRAAGFDVVYAPTAQNPLHVRIIPATAQFTEAGSEELYIVFERLGKKK
jgi:hypothetical protein